MCLTVGSMGNRKEEDKIPPVWDPTVWLEGQGIFI